MEASRKLRVVFMGTPEFAVPALRAVVDAGHHVIAVYTRPPAARGRGQQVQKSPVHVFADEQRIPVYTPVSLKRSPEAQAEFAAQKPDVAVVAAYGLILPPAVLSAPKYGCINIHASLLPRWRGASPIQHAILYGDELTGVTIMQMEEGLDTGPMIISDKIRIDETMATPALHDALSVMGARLIVGVLGDLAAERDVPCVPQLVAGVTHAPMLKKEDGGIDWQDEAMAIARRVRAFDPWPGTTARLPDGQVVKILCASAKQEPSTSMIGTLVTREGLVACGSGTTLKIEQVQAPNGKRMGIADLVNGGYIAVGDRFQ